MSELQRLQFSVMWQPIVWQTEGITPLRRNLLPPSSGQGSVSIYLL